MENEPLRVVVDTNVLISSLIFGGKPRQIITLIQNHKIVAVTSPLLIAELVDILVKKFYFIPAKVELTLELIKENFTIVYPTEVVDAVRRDQDDNKVLEAAIEGHCSHLVTGDSHLLDLALFRNIVILKPDDFLSKKQD